jgi:anthranilate synthase component 1
LSDTWFKPDYFDPADEDLECHNKARALLATVPAAERMTQRRKAAGTQA